MIGKKSLILLVTIIFFVLNSHGQVAYKFDSGEKQTYSIGDEFAIQFLLTVDPKSCQDGMSKTGIYPSGIEITGKSDWQELQKGLWQIKLKCKIMGNKKGFGQLTLVRKTDKQNLFKQVKFNVGKNVGIGNE